MATWALIAIVGVSCLYWAAAAVLSLRAAAAMRPLSEAPLPEREDWPRVTMVVPAANEGATIEAATESKRASDYPRLELVLVDDRSEDETGAVIDRLAAADERVRALHVTELPPGWIGKVHAMDQGVRAGEGEWVLLTDADVHLAPDAIRRAVASAEARGLDHLAVIPSPIPAGLLEDATVAAVMRVLLVVGRPTEVERPDRRAAAGVGAFNLVRRSALERAGGLAELRMEVADDVALGRLLKESGGRPGLALGLGLVAVQLYPSLSAMAHAMERVGLNFRFRPLPAVATGLAMALLEAGPFLGAALDALPSAARLASGLVGLAALGATALACRRVGVPLLSAFLSPVGGVILAAFALRGGLVSWRRGGLLWRGTLYRGEELLAGWRYGKP